MLLAALAFVFGYSLTMLPQLQGGLTVRRSLPLTFASDTLSIATMELLGTLVILIVPGAMNADSAPRCSGVARRRAVLRLLGCVPRKSRAHGPRQRARGHPRLPLGRRPTVAHRGHMGRARMPALRGMHV